MSIQRWASCCLAFAGLAPAAHAWNIEPCSQEHAAEWVGFAQQMREAKPGSPVFVPHPFPTTQDQVVDNFLFQQKEIWSDLPFDKLPPEERRFATVIQADQVRYELLRVENWTPLFCGPERKREFYFLLRVFDRRTGSEVSRASIDDNGLLGALLHLPGGTEEAEGPRRFFDLSEARRFAAAVEFAAEELQHVTTYGTLRCHALSPCVAFRQRGEVYLIEAQGSSANLYRLELEKPRLSFKADLSPVKRRAGAMEQLRRGGRAVVSLGGDALTTAVAAESRKVP